MNNIFLTSKFKVASFYLVDKVLYITIAPAIMIQDSAIESSIVPLKEIDIELEVIYTKFVTVKSLNIVLNNISDNDNIQLKTLNLSDGISAHMAMDLLSKIIGQ